MVEKIAETSRVDFFKVVSIASLEGLHCFSKFMELFFIKAFKYCIHLKQTQSC